MVNEDTRTSRRAGKRLDIREQNNKKSIWLDCPLSSTGCSKRQGEGWRSSNGDVRGGLVGQSLGRSGHKGG